MPTILRRRHFLEHEILLRAACLAQALGDLLLHACPQLRISDRTIVAIGNKEDIFGTFAVGRHLGRLNTQLADQEGKGHLM